MIISNVDYTAHAMHTRNSYKCFNVTVIINEILLVGLEFSFERVVRIGTERNKYFLNESLN